MIPWRLDVARIEEDLFNLAAAQPPAQRRLTIAGCRQLGRQFRERVAAHHARAIARVVHSRACAFDLHALLPVPATLLELGPNDPETLAWLAAHWGTQCLRHVEVRPGRPGRRLPAGHAVIGYGFFTEGETPQAAVSTLATSWPELRFVLGRAVALTPNQRVANKPAVATMSLTTSSSPDASRCGKWGVRVFDEGDISRSSLSRIRVKV
ncbi:MAG TPA: hypothetical protein VJY39_03280 [Acidisphaera sp.]|nr:hypothetical protein [Acidisphaera sp.]